MRTRPLPPYLQRWFDPRTGKTYLRFRKRGHQTVTLPQPIGSEEFWTTYRVALAGKKEIGADRSAAGSASAALAAYYTSHSWRNDLSDGTRRQRRPILERFRNRYGPWPLRQITGNFIEAYLDLLKPQAARNTRNALRGFLKHAKHDVTRGIALPKIKSNKHPSWPPELIAKYEACHPIGSKARLALALPKYTGAGRSEVSRLGPQHIVGDEISIPPRAKTGVPASFPLHPALRKVIEATTPIGLSTFLITKSGKPYQPNDLSDEFRAWCDQAGIPPAYSLHGLRHALGDSLAELGCSPNQIAAILAQMSPRSAIHYTQGASRKKLARQAMALLIASTDQDRSGNEGVSVENAPQTLGGENT
jgi:hypothetical protein